MDIFWHYQRIYNVAQRFRIYWIADWAHDRQRKHYYNEYGGGE